MDLMCIVYGSLWKRSSITWIRKIRKHLNLPKKRFNVLNLTGRRDNAMRRLFIKMSAKCTDEVIRLLREIKKNAINYDHDPEASLNTAMNAQVIADAEQY